MDRVGTQWRWMLSVGVGVVAVALVALVGLGPLRPMSGEAWMARGMTALALVLLLAVPFGLLGMMVARIVSGAGRSRLEDRRAAEEREACPDCGQGIESQWEACPFCGADVAEGHSSSSADGHNST